MLIVNPNPIVPDSALKITWRPDEELAGVMARLTWKAPCLGVQLFIKSSNNTFYRASATHFPFGDLQGWIRFTRPGEYRLYLFVAKNRSWAGDVYFDDDGNTPMGVHPDIKEIGTLRIDGITIPNTLFAQRTWYQDRVEKYLGIKARDQCELREMTIQYCIRHIANSLVVMLYYCCLLPLVAIIFACGYWSPDWKAICRPLGLKSQNPEKQPLGPNHYHSWLKRIQSRLTPPTPADHWDRQNRKREARWQQEAQIAQSAFQMQYARLASGKPSGIMPVVTLRLIFNNAKGAICRPFARER